MIKRQISATFISNGLVYGLNGIYTIMPLFLAEYFNNIEMGYLLAIQPLLLCIAPFFWGEITDRAKTQNIVMILVVAGAGISLCSVLFNQNFYFVAVALMLYAIFQSPFGSLIDVLTVRAAEKFKMNYGFFRITGTVMFCVAAFAVTLLTNTEYAFYVYAAIAMLACFSVWDMPKVVKIKSEKPEGNIGGLLKNKELWLLNIILGLGFFTFGYYSSFFPTYITETLGLKKSVWGIVAFLTAFSEVPFFVYYSKIFDKISLRTIVSVSSLAMMIRWVVFATVKNTVVLIGVSFVTGLFITVLTYCVTFYIVSTISAGLVNRAQSLMYAVGTGIPKMLAACIGGYMTEYLTEPVAFAICAVISFSGLVLGLGFKKTMWSIDEKLRKHR